MIPDQLQEIAEDVKIGKTRRASARELLSWFRYERRGSWIVWEIRRLLDELGLRTAPDFEHAWIDETLSFVPREEVIEGATGHRGPKLDDEDIATWEEMAAAHGEEVVEALKKAGVSPLPRSVLENLLVDGAPDEPKVGGALADPAYRIGKLDAANREPVFVSPDTPLCEAITIMMREDFSQLPVMTSDREVKGVISWKTIGTRLALGKQCTSVRDCMDQHPEIISAETSLFRAIDLIVQHEFVLVRKADKRIGGIVTATDLSVTFDQLGRPFLLLSEIENLIRGLIGGKFTVEQLEAARNPTDGSREVRDVSDLTLGEYARLLQKPDHWNHLGLRIDRVTFGKGLLEICRIRNDVMHFDPDGIGDGDLEKL